MGLVHLFPSKQRKQKVPFVVFWLTGRVHRSLVPRLLLLFVLGGLQGVLGWYMVMSGLVERTDVSQYRLSAHLTLATIIFAAIIWTALGIGHDKRRPVSLKSWVSQYTEGLPAASAAA